MCARSSKQQRAVGAAPRGGSLGAAASVDGPLSSNTGGKQQRLGRGTYLGIDWIEAKTQYSPAAWEWVVRYLGARCGDPVETRPGRVKGYAHGLAYACGLSVAWNPDRMGGTIKVVGTGTWCAEVESEAVLDFLRTLCTHGYACARLDLACDRVGCDGSLVRQIRGACREGKLCGLRKWTVIEGDGGGLTVALGRRGSDGACRYVRAYDKGVESGTAEAGWHERFEVEFREQVAQQVLEQLLGSSWRRRAMEFIAGACDFRELAGGARDERDRCGWWRDFCGCVRARVIVTPRRLRSAERYAGWLRKAVAPGVAAIAALTGLAAAEVYASLCSDVGASSSLLRANHVRQLSESFG